MPQKGMRLALLAFNEIHGWLAEICPPFATHDAGVKMKQLHWKAVADTQLKGTVWAELKVVPISHLKL